MSFLSCNTTGLSNFVVSGNWTYNEDTGEPDNLQTFGTVFTQAGVPVGDVGGSPTNVHIDPFSNNSGSFTANVAGFGPLDTGLKVRAAIVTTGLGFTRNGSFINYKSNAAAPTAGTPASSAVTKNTATINCDYNANVVTSTATVKLQYKKQSDSTWIDAGTADTATDSNSHNISRNLTGLTPNTVYNFRLVMTRTTNNITSLTSSTSSFTTLPDTPQVTTSAATGVTYNDATIGGTFNPQTFASDFYVDWGTAPGVYDLGSHLVGSFSDSSDHALTFTLPAYLAYSTTFYFRARAVYSGGTVNGNELSFTTSAPPATPDVTTKGSSNVFYQQATLSGTLGTNGHPTTHWFDYGLTTGYGSTTPTLGPTSAATPFDWSQTITGLTGSTTYHFRAHGLYNGTDYVGADMQFTTPATPTQQALEEDHMQIFEFNERKYGVQSTFNLLLAQPMATTSDRWLTTATPFAAGDVQISKDGGAFANVTNLPVQIGSSAVYVLTLTATEMQASTIVVQIIDQTDPPDFRDAVVVIRTLQELSLVDIDATAGPTNSDALKLTKNGTGKALNATGDLAGSAALTLGGGVAITGALAVSTDLTVGGNVAITGTFSAASIAGVLTSMVLRTGTAQAGGAATITLDSGAVATDNYYNNHVVMIISGTGAGQARMIQSYVGSTKVATVTTGWSVNPSSSSVFVILPGPDVWNMLPTAELASLPAYGTATFGQLLQLCFQRFVFKRVQTASAQTLYKSDSSTSLASGTFTDGGTSQTIGKLS